MPAENGSFDLASRFVGALPIINRFLYRLRIESMLQCRLEVSDVRCKIPAARVLMALLRNLIVSRVPLYSMAEWVQTMLPEAVGLTSAEVGVLNDDRIGRALDELFDCDRQALLTDFVLRMVREYRIDLRELHNDSTSLTLQGQYREADGRQLRGKPSLKVTFGYNKDHRPDLKQLLWILTVSSDGAVPVQFKVTHGNIEDSGTHMETWKVLRQLVGTPRFLYIADSKLCTSENLRYIDGKQGGFLTPLPGSRKEDAQFRAWLSDHEPQWQEVAHFVRPGQLLSCADVIRAIESPIPEVNGFRLVWFFSSHKCQRDADKRQDAILRATKQLEKLKERLEGPRCRFKHLKTVTQAVEKILDSSRCRRWIDYTVDRTHELKYRFETRKRRGSRIKRCIGSVMRFQLTWKPNVENIRKDSKSDGISPLVTNRSDLSPLQLYNAYHRNHSFLELRHDLLKNTLQAVPVYIHSVARLEAFLLLEYFAITVHALIERGLRSAMRSRQMEQIPLYPEARECKAPTAARLLDVFDHLAVHDLMEDGKSIQRFQPQLTQLQLDLLDLLGMPADIYAC
jgi:transposase